MAGDVWTIQRILEWTCGYLERKGDEHPRLSAEWLLSDATGLSRVELYMSFDRPLSGDELARMHEGVERRGAGEPLQYVTGEMAFRHIVVRCEPGVLIPRPETEVLVEVALEALHDQRGDAPALVMEPCTGTGCVACSLARERSKTHVVATDISLRAASLARRNRDALGLSGLVDVLECDLLGGVEPRLMGHADLLISNPPYIPSETVRTLPGEVRDFEPGLALDGGPDGLAVLRRLLDVAPRALNPGGVFAAELFEDTLDVAASLARAQGIWQRVEVREDLTHRPRVLLAVRADA